MVVRPPPIYALQTHLSRAVTKIEKSETGFIITDLESLNGTFVNDVPVRSRLLEHGDRAHRRFAVPVSHTRRRCNLEVERRQAR